MPLQSGGDYGSRNLRGRTSLGTVSLEKIDYALSFDGVNDYVTILNASSLNPSFITISLLGQVNLSAINIYAVLLSKGTTMYQVEVFSDGRMRCRFITSDNKRYLITLPAGTFPSNQWRHVALTFDGETLKVFLDGDLIDSTTTYVSVTRNDARNLILGCVSPRTSGYYHPGLLDEVRIWNQALTEQEIKSDIYRKTPISDGLVLWLPMDEGSGSTVNDNSGQNNNGTIDGATWVVK